jgi:hypothetical protein
MLILPRGQKTKRNLYYPPLGHYPKCIKDKKLGHHKYLHKLLWLLSKLSVSIFLKFWFKKGPALLLVFLHN